MRLFGLVCFAIAAFYGYTAVDAMRTGVVSPLAGDTSAEHRRDDPASSFRKLMAARWLFAGGFVAVGFVMHIFAGRFEKLERDGEK